MSVKSVSLYPALKTVTHTESNDNEEFIANDGSLAIRELYCPYPMPVQYELLPVLHNDVTAAKPANCPGEGVCCELMLAGRKQSLFLTKGVKPTEI